MSPTASLLGGQFLMEMSSLLQCICEQRGTVGFVTFGGKRQIKEFGEVCQRPQEAVKHTLGHFGP